MALRNSFAVLMPGDLDFPELLHAALYDWFGNHIYPTLTH
jgi:hypothetical protein